jgi:hypothetical protein
MGSKCLFFFFLATNVATAQNTFKANTYTYEKYEGSLNVKLIFNETVSVWSVIDSIHYLPLVTDSVLILEFVGSGNYHRDGYCEIQATLQGERFYVCKDRVCFLLTISPPLFKNKKTTLKYLYKNCVVTWDEGNDEARIEWE